MIICDLDDFAEDMRSVAYLGRLISLHDAIPTFKATLFTIPGRCSERFIERMLGEFPWLDLVPHGWAHRTNRECEAWTKTECRTALAAARELGITTKGFKAPGWQISNGCYEALVEDGYWVADQEYNDVRRPENIPVYRLRSGGTDYTDKSGKLYWRTECNNDNTQWGMILVKQFHGHVGHLGGHNANALEFIAPQILEAAKTDSDFRFIHEVMG